MKKNILILGSNGQLGSKLSISLKKDKKFKIKTLAKSNANFSFDIENFSKLEEILINENFTHVINCIAHTNLEYCEKNYKKIYKVNVLLPKKLSDLSKKHKFKLVHISTDHIYKAKKNKLNSEKDKVGWHNNYSKSKFLAEKKIKNNKDVLIIRTNFMLNKKSKKSFIYWLNENIKKKRLITLFEDMYTSTIDIKSLITIIKKLIIKNGNGTYNLGSSQCLSKLEFARKYFKLIKKKPKIKILKTNNDTNLVLRGRYLGLNVNKIERKLNMNMPSTNKVLQNLL